MSKAAVFFFIVSHRMRPVLFRNIEIKKKTPSWTEPRNFPSASDISTGIFVVVRSLNENNKTSEIQSRMRTQVHMIGMWLLWFNTWYCGMWCLRKNNFVIHFANCLNWQQKINWRSKNTPKTIQTAYFYPIQNMNVHWSCARYAIR